MSAQYIQEGNAVDYTPTEDVAAGTVVVQGDLVGITKRDIKANTLGALAVVGVFDVPKDPAAEIDAGALVYWDATNEQAVTTASGNKLLGKALLPAPATNTNVRIRLSQ